MPHCPECGAVLGDDAQECFHCHARFEGRMTAGEVRRQARRGALQGALLAGVGIIVTIIAISMLVEACVR